MRISEVAKKTGVHTRTIHFYIQEGLLAPRKEDNGYFDFEQEEIDWLLTVHQLRQRGVPLQYIKDLMKHPHSVNYVIYHTIEKLKKEITLRQTQIENLIQITKQITPYHDIHHLAPFLETAPKTYSDKFDIESIYPTNHSYMATIYLLVQFVVSEPKIYQQYLWDQLAQEMSSVLGPAIYFLNNIIESKTLAELDLSSAELSQHSIDVLSEPDDSVGTAALLHEVHLLMQEPSLRQKWKLLYRPLIRPLLQFYIQSESLLLSYNEDYQLYMTKMRRIIRAVVSQMEEEQLTQPFLQLMGHDFFQVRDDLYSDFLILFTFRYSFYTDVPIDQMTQYLQRMNRSE